MAWWAFGAFCYGLGAGCEALITLFGNDLALTKAWYITGALLGGYPLAQGTVYLLMKRTTATKLAYVSAAFVCVVSVLVVICPTHPELLQPNRPTGAVLSWVWLRAMTPIINLYAVSFLIGGAISSARRYAKQGMLIHARGNALIAIGAILPGIGGSFAKAGLVEALYIGECIGIMLIWLGYEAIVATKGSETLGSQVSSNTPAHP